MIKTIWLDTLKFIRPTDTSSFILTENEDLYYVFNSHKYNIDEAVITIENGIVKQSYIMPPTHSLKIPKDLLFVGNLLITVTANIKTWVIAGLTIKEVEHNMLYESALKTITDDYTALIDGVRQTVKDNENTATQAYNSLTDIITDLNTAMQTMKVSYDEQIKLLEARIKALESDNG